ncbi:putative Sex-lethal like protein [Blattamonas nauphoetae]|uniref:Sex-lethal like protein n=1 Tax=Blattamonas nauphoetae TaxID=2049346 RepID=A0ABQ9XUZ6_9EUKA|nr:putative Sex-lethal like protein [Blattamonas nauphoetae]
MTDPSSSSQLDLQNLYVKNLPPLMDDSNFFTLFSRFGRVVSAKVMIGRKSGQSLGFGFVKFQTEDEAAAAINEMNGTVLEGQTLEIKYSNKGKDESIFPPDRNLYLKPLPFDLTEKELHKLFIPFGKITDYRILSDPVTQQSRQVGFVRFEKLESAIQAHDKMNGYYFRKDLAPLTVRYAESASMRDHRREERKQRRKVDEEEDKPKHKKREISVSPKVAKKGGFKKEWKATFTPRLHLSPNPVAGGSSSHNSSNRILTPPSLGGSSQLDTQFVGVGGNNIDQSWASLNPLDIQGYVPGSQISPHLRMERLPSASSSLSDQAADGIRSNRHLTPPHSSQLLSTSPSFSPHKFSRMPQAHQNHPQFGLDMSPVGDVIASFGSIILSIVAKRHRGSYGSDRLSPRPYLRHFTKRIIPSVICAFWTIAIVDTAREFASFVCPESYDHGKTIVVFTSFNFVDRGTRDISCVSTVTDKHRFTFVKENRIEHVQRSGKREHKTNIASGGIAGGTTTEDGWIGRHDLSHNRFMSLASSLFDESGFAKMSTETRTTSVSDQSSLGSASLPSFRIPTSESSMNSNKQLTRHSSSLGPDDEEAASETGSLYSLMLREQRKKIEETDNKNDEELLALLMDKDKWEGSGATPESTIRAGTKRLQSLPLFNHVFPNIVQRANNPQSRNEHVGTLEFKLDSSVVIRASIAVISQNFNFVSTSDMTTIVTPAFNVDENEPLFSLRNSSMSFTKMIFPLTNQIIAAVDEASHFNAESCILKSNGQKLFEVDGTLILINTTLFQPTTASSLIVSPSANGEVGLFACHLEQTRNVANSPILGDTFRSLKLCHCEIRNVSHCPSALSKKVQNAEQTSSLIVGNSFSFNEDVLDGNVFVGLNEHFSFTSLNNTHFHTRRTGLSNTDRQVITTANTTTNNLFSFTSDIFDGCTAHDLDGGAISFKHSANLEIEMCSFETCSVTGTNVHAGAVYFSSTAPSGQTAEFLFSNFTSCSSEGEAGAIQQFSPTIGTFSSKVDVCRFVGNKADYIDSFQAHRAVNVVISSTVFRDGEVVRWEGPVKGYECQNQFDISFCELINCTGRGSGQFCFRVCACQISIKHVKASEFEDYVGPVIVVGDSPGSDVSHPELILEDCWIETGKVTSGGIDITVDRAAYLNKDKIVRCYSTSKGLSVDYPVGTGKTSPVS